MEQIVTNLFTAVATIAIPVVSGLALKVAKQAADALAAKTENETIDRICNEIPKAVEDAVRMTFQTYVDNLKAGGLFDAEAQKKALQMALQACLLSLSQSAQDYIKDTTGDVTGYLTNCIEAEVKRQKLFDTPALPAVTNISAT